MFRRPCTGVPEGVGASGSWRPPRAQSVGGGHPGPQQPGRLGGRGQRPRTRSALLAGQTRLAAALTGRGQRGRPLLGFALQPLPLASWALGGCRARPCETTAEKTLATLRLWPPRGYTLHSFPRPPAATPSPTGSRAPRGWRGALFGGREGVEPPALRFMQPGQGVGTRMYPLIVRQPAASAQTRRRALGSGQDLAGPYPLHLSSPPNLRDPGMLNTT